MIKRGEILKAGAVVGISVAALSACTQGEGGEGPARTPTHTEVTVDGTPSPAETETAVPAENEVQQVFNEAKAERDAFIAALTAEQKMAYDNLRPETLAAMDRSELEAALVIPLSEVADENGEIDPDKFAASMTFRNEAVTQALCTDTLLNKYGGPGSISEEQQITELAKFSDSFTSALTTGTTGSRDLAFMNRCIVVEGARDISDDATAAVDKYSIIQYVKPDSVVFDTATGNLSYSMHTVDNYDPDSFEQFIGNIKGDQQNSYENQYLYGAAVNDEGNVVSSQNPQ